MNFIKFTIFTLLLALTISTPIYASKKKAVEITMKYIGDLLFHEKRMAEELISRGLSEAEAARHASDITIALKNLNLPTKDGAFLQATNMKELEKIINQIPQEDLDFMAKINMIDIFKKDIKNKDNNKQLIAGISKLYYISTRYGADGTVYAACGGCASKKANDLGFEYVLEKIVHAKTSRLFRKVQNNEGVEGIAKNLRVMLKEYGLTDEYVNERLGKVNETQLYVFLKIFREENIGTPLQKRYVNKVMKLSKTDGGYGRLLDHALWNNIDLFNNEKKLIGWTNLIDSTKKNFDELKMRPTTGKDTELKDAWYYTLRKKSKKDKRKLAKVDDMEARGCFMDPRR